MSNVLALVKAARAASQPRAVLRSKKMLKELLALNRDMIEQLGIERLSEGENQEFLTEMIGQHLRAVALLEAELNHP
jgi:hypothetical protein